MEDRRADTAATFARVLLVGVALSFAATSHAVDAGADPCVPTVKLWRFGPEAPVGAEIVPFCDYVGLVNSGVAQQIAPRIIARQRQRDDKTDAENERLIKAYMRRHPDLTDLRALMRGKIKKSPTRRPTPDGNWKVTLPDGSQVVTLGRRAMLQNLADGIHLATDRDRQLQHYSELYGELPGPALDPASNGGVVLPTPASLGEASIAEIATALHQMTGLSTVVEASMPVGPPVGPIEGCGFEVGASPVRGDYVYENPDGPRSKSLQVKDGFGLFATFTFPSKPYLTCVKAQSLRGTCKAFASMSATEMMIAATTGTRVNLSEQDVWEHYNLALWGGNPVWYGESGTAKTILHGMTTSGYGIPYESSWDYNPSQSRKVVSGKYIQSCAGYPPSPHPQEPCSDTTPQAVLVCGLLDPNTGNVVSCALKDAGIPGSPHRTTFTTDYWNEADRAGSTDNIILHLALKHGVALGFAVTDRFMNLAFHQPAGNTFVDNPYGGYLPFDADDLKTGGPGHGVHVVGFISNEDVQLAIPGAPLAPTKGYFIIKNSYGFGWGDGGYGYLPWDYVKARGYEAVYVHAVQ